MEQSDYPPEYEILRTIETFTGDRIGAIGLTPAHIAAWRRLLLHERADECFKQLIERADLPGQLYGLAGVYFTDHSSLAALAAPYKVNQSTVKTISTCMVGTTPIGDIVAQIEGGVLPSQLRDALNPRSGAGESP